MLGLLRLKYVKSVFFFFFLSSTSKFVSPNKYERYKWKNPKHNNWKPRFVFNFSVITNFAVRCQIISTARIPWTTIHWTITTSSPTRSVAILGVLCLTKSASLRTERSQAIARISWDIARRSRSRVILGSKLYTIHVTWAFLTRKVAFVLPSRMEKKIKEETCNELLARKGKKKLASLH